MSVASSKAYMSSLAAPARRSSRRRPRCGTWHPLTMNQAPWRYHPDGQPHRPIAQLAASAAQVVPAGARVLLGPAALYLA